MDRLVRRRMRAIIVSLCLVGIHAHAFAQEPAPAPITPSPSALPAQPAQAEPVKEPLHTIIDRLLVAELPHLSASPAPDGVFLRRLSLDLRGVVPTAEELAAFKSDTDPNKRATWVDRFMSDPLHQEHMVDWLDKTLMQRRPFAQVDRNAWLKWLRDSVEAKTSLSALVTQILTANWWDNSQRPALRFFLERSGDPHLITRDLSRVMLGRDQQCNQCHDHPLVDEYRQVDYQGMFAFISGSGLVEGTTKDDKGADVKSQLYVERPGADAPFESVFVKGVALRTGPRLPVGVEIQETYLEPDARLQKDPQPTAFAGAPKPPVQSRRAMLADQLVNRQTRLFARNFANRIWAIAFGRGLVHPLDMHHADNPPAHPEVLEHLTTALIDMQFDYDRLLKELVLTNAYGRATDTDFQPWPIALTAPADAGAAGLAEIVAAATARKDLLNAELTKANEADTVAEQELEKVSTAWREAQAVRNAARAEVDKAEAAFNDVKKKSDDAAAAHQVAIKKHQDSAARIALIDEAAAKLQQAIGLSAGGADAELAAALAASKAKADAARAELPALEKASVDAKAGADTALAAVEAPRAKVKEAAGALAVQQTALATADASYAQARQAWASGRSRIALLMQQLDRCEDCLAMVEAITAARQQAGQRSAVESQLVAEQGKLPGLNEQVKVANDALAVGNQQLADANAALTSSKQAMAKHEAELAQLRETLAQLEKATALVSTPDPLKAASAVINENLAAKTASTSGLVTTLSQNEQAVTTATTNLAALQAAHATASQTLAAQQNVIAGKQTELNAQATSLNESISQARDAWQTVMSNQQVALAVGATRPLSPEQLGQSILRITGVFDNYVNVELAELQKNSPLPEGADAATLAKRQQQAVRGAWDKLRGNVDIFANLYASGVGQTADEFFASPDQALYMANGGAVFPWSGPNGQNVTARMIAQKDNTAAATELITILLARDPQPGEIAFVAEQLTAAGDARAAVCQELVWATLTGVEFRFYR